MDYLKLPELDLKVLEEKAKEYAMKGAIEEIKEYYTGYSSPFRKKIKEDLDKNAVSIHLELPDILALINDALTTEIDRIANTSIGETFLPLATNALTRISGDVKFSDLLSEFVNCCYSDFKDGYRPEVSIGESTHGWLDVKLSFTDFRDKENVYKLTLHKGFKDQGEGKYCILSLPHSETPYNYTKTMKLSNGESTLEIPFTRDSLKDEFTSYIARILISKSLIVMDCNDFQDDMFSDDDE
jgi:hypothetical protein